VQVHVGRLFVGERFILAVFLAGVGRWSTKGASMKVQEILIPDGDGSEGTATLYTADGRETVPMHIERCQYCGMGLAVTVEGCKKCPYCSTVQVPTVLDRIDGLQDLVPVTYVLFDQILVEVER
jgi:hypothetical protein